MNDPKAGHESDFVSFWLLLLFIAAFFGIATEGARRPLFTSETKATYDVRANAIQNLDLLSREQVPSTGPVGHRGEKFEVPATGK